MKKALIVAAALLAMTAGAALGAKLQKVVRAPGQIDAAEVVKIDPQSGDVFINWTKVHGVAEGRYETDPLVIVAAKIMLAVKSGKWKPMK